MPNFKFSGYWTESFQHDNKIPKGFILFEYEPFYRDAAGKFFKKLDEYQKTKYSKAIESGKDVTFHDYLRKMDISISYHYRKRTLDQNALMWSLYHIEANEQNGGQSGHKEQTITPMELYIDDLREHGERETVITKRKNLGYYLSSCRIVEPVLDGNEISIDSFRKIVMHDDDKITLKIVWGSSTFNTKEMANWIDRIFNRLAYHGINVTDSGHILQYWKEWRQHLNDNKVNLFDSIMTKEDYKAMNVICEACGEFISEGEGELAHIKAVGMGRTRELEPKKNYTRNWLHLHANPCHRIEWHEKGIESFLKRFPHLGYKVRTALNRDYKPINSHEEILEGDYGNLVHEGKESATEDDYKPNESKDLSLTPEKCSECGNYFDKEECPICHGHGLY